MARRRVKAAQRHRKARMAGLAALGGYDAQSLNQGQACAICGYKPKPNGRRLSLDHDHLTMAPRGLICTKCNRGLAWFRDDPMRLLCASYYLKSGWQAAIAFRDAYLTMRGPNVL